MTVMAFALFCKVFLPVLFLFPLGSLVPPYKFCKFSFAVHLVFSFSASSVYASYVPVNSCEYTASRGGEGTEHPNYLLLSSDTALPRDPRQVKPFCVRGIPADLSLFHLSSFPFSHTAIVPHSWFTLESSFLGLYVSYPGKRQELRIDASFFFFFSTRSSDIRRYTACYLTLAFCHLLKADPLPRIGVALLCLMNLSATFAIVPGSVEV